MRLLLGIGILILLTIQVSAQTPQFEDSAVMFWGRIGFFVVLGLIGVAIWYFKVHKQPPEGG
jgi:hypothetical protein